LTALVPVRPRRQRFTLVGRAWIAAAISIIVGACGSPVTSPASVTVTSAATLPAASSASPTAAASTIFAPSPSLPGPSRPPVVLDADLLSVVPVANRIGFDVTYDPVTSATVAGDAGVAQDATGLAVALVRVTGSAADAADIAVMSVIRLRDPKVDEAWFRSWRDSYDESACAQAGGVVRHAEVTIAGHLVFVGSCAGGAFTYHTRVRDGELVVSVTSVGPARLGEMVMMRLAS
jgi:hypothetical protein